MKENEKFQKWATDLARTKNIDTTFFGSVVLVELYKKDTEGSEGEAELIYSEEPGSVKRRNMKLGSLLYPIAKVLAVGENVSEDYKDIKVGDILMLTDSISSIQTNPEYLNILLSYKSNEVPKVAEGISKKITAFDSSWARYSYKLDKFKDTEAEDVVTLLLPLLSTFVLGKYEI